jgi:DNA-binding HxlR family transcriptional regulator
MAAVKALIEGWSSMMMRSLAAGPLSLTELDGVISGISYPSLKRRLAAMRLAGQVTALPNRANSTPYTVTAWLRRGIGPLAAATRWERRHLDREAIPITRVDTETVFLLALPLLRLPSELSGSCRLGVEMANGQRRRLVGAMARLEDGRIASCSVRLESTADAWATGSVTDWLHALVVSDTDRLELGGRQHVARTLLERLHSALFF